MAEAVRITGLNEVSRSFASMGTLAQAELKTALRAAANPVKQDAARRLPNRSGKLSASLRTAARTSPRSTSVSVRMGGARTPYAGWIEFGGTIRGSGRAPGHDIRRPFKRGGRYLNEALDAQRPHVLPLIQAAVNDAIERAF